MTCLTICLLIAIYEIAEHTRLENSIYIKILHAYCTNNEDRWFKQMGNDNDGKARYYQPIRQNHEMSQNSNNQITHKAEY